MTDVSKENLDRVKEWLITHTKEDVDWKYYALHYIVLRQALKKENNE